MGSGILIYRSASMRTVMDKIEKVSSSDIQVLIVGESGTGKELIARSIHEAGERRGRSFVAVNCSAIPEGLYESEMFGHSRGAFTGADRDRGGLFEEANGGSLFLDEIAELPLAAQAKLLRILQDRELRRVGENRTRKLDFRLISATHRDLLHEVASRRFREDLYYRIAGFSIDVPPLRARREDIPVLLGHFMDRYAEKGRRRFSGEVMSLLRGYPWPGNVRELINVVRQAMLVAGYKETVELGDLPVRVREYHSFYQARMKGGGLRAARLSFEREYLRMALKENGGNRTKTARILGLSRQSLIRKIGLYGLDKKGKGV